MQKSSYAGSKLYLALLALRTSPNSITGVSLAELLMGRRLRSRIPVLPEALVPSISDISVVREQDCQSKQCQAQYYNRRHGTKRLSVLAQGNRLLVWDMNTRNCRITATMIKKMGARSYLIQLNNGRKLRRNRHQLQVRLKGVSEINLNKEIDYDSFDDDQIRDKEEEVTSGGKEVQEESGTNMNSNHSSKDGTITTQREGQ